MRRALSLATAGLILAGCGFSTSIGDGRTATPPSQAASSKIAPSHPPISASLTKTASTTAAPVKTSLPSSKPTPPRQAPLKQVPAYTLLTTHKRSTYSVNTLVIGTKSNNPKYQRESQFGGWVDTDHNGCDTRNDVLKRDLSNVTFKAGSKCLVASGTLLDPYDGDVLPFKRGATTSRLVQVDHIVSVADAWKSGASKWTPAKRIAFYNDPLNLIAVEGFINDQKSDKTADSWMPPMHKCEFAMTQIAVKNKWHLIVSQQEMTVLNYACAKG